MFVGISTLIVVAILIYIGVAQRVLDRLRLTDREALLFIAAMAVGNMLPEIPITANVAVNIGGAVVPAVLVGYLLVRAGTAGERNRAIIATLVATAAIYGANKLLPAHPFEVLPVDPMYLWAVIAAAAGYLAGRSRRSAFIAGVGSMILFDVVSRIEVAYIGGESSVTIGGAGLFDGVVIVGVLAVALAEIFGETQERLQGGPSKNRPRNLKKGLSGPKVVPLRREKDDDDEK
ncbi:MAG: DUF1614 domain-containing protein [Firmicutes bacterium]|nr:DUF1614 domain-containing protein [Bacillota bacterium]